MMIKTIMMTLQILMNAQQHTFVILRLVIVSTLKGTIVVNVKRATHRAPHPTKSAQVKIVFFNYVDTR